MSEDPNVEALRQDDSNWKLGLFYASMRDRAPLIPKRYGWGWTINFGSPWTWLIEVILAIVIVWGVFF